MRRGSVPGLSLAVVSRDQLLLAGGWGLADLAEVESLIKDWDTRESIAINDVRIFRLKNALAAELAQVLANLLTNGDFESALTGWTVTAGGARLLEARLFRFHEGRVERRQLLQQHAD